MMVVMVARGGGGEQAYSLLRDGRAVQEGAGGKHLGRTSMGWREGGEVEGGKGE